MTMQMNQRNGSQVSLPLQLSYLFLFALGVIACLWQRGQPILVFGILILLFPLGMLGRLPRQWFPGWARQILQVVIAGGGLAWWYLRMDSTAVDIVLVETAAVLGLALSVGGVAKEYGLMGLISLVLLGYGGMMPGRAVYLPVLGIYIGFGILVFYQTRTAKLALLTAGWGRLQRPSYVDNWAYRAGHLTLVVAFFLLLLLWFPMPSGRSVGLIPVGFRTSQGLEFPSLWRQWLNPATQLFARAESEGDQMMDTQDPAGNPEAQDQDAETAAEQKDGSRMDAREGSGGGGIGTDLVLRVHSPAKLYWLTQLYDVYSGKQWRASMQLRRRRSALDRVAQQHFRVVDQVVNVEKNVSSRIAGAYRAVTHSLLGGVDWAEIEEMGGLIREDVAGAGFQGKAPDTPWRYRVRSHVPTFDSDNVLPDWESGDRGGWNYLRLPEGIVSERVRRLARDITAGCNTPMEKAFALQNHLRTHYKYELEVPAIPEDREPVDFFLFEMRAGYCQHFAQAFTVMARLVGLPARLAAGYSPGNYNVLTAAFEVYEYHAHAWTQIYIEPYGWLTFDGVAPGDLRLETNPRFLKRLMDPFGDEWAAHPPELSVTQEMEAPRPRQTRPAGERSRLVALGERVYTKAAVDSRSAEPTPPAVIKAAGELLRQWLTQTWDMMIRRFAAWCSHVARRGAEGWQRVVNFLGDLSAAAYVVVGALATAAVYAWRRRRFLSSLVRERYERWQLERRWRQVANMRGQVPPHKIVALTVEVLRRMLALGHYAQPPGMDMSEYADSLRSQDARLGSACGVIADVVARQAFREAMPTDADAERVCDALGEVRLEVMGRVASRHRPSRRH